LRVNWSAPELPNPDHLATSIVQLCDAAQHTAMSTLQTPLNEYQHITPPSSFIDAPLTPPPTDEKAFTQAPRVIALFKDIQAGRHIKQHPWTEFQLARKEYEEIERRLRRDESLLGYVKDKIRRVGLKERERRQLMIEIGQI
jgi:hypothetical protein